MVCIAEIIRTNQHYRLTPASFEVSNSSSVSVSFFSTPWSLMGTWFEEHIPEGSVVATPYKDIAPFAPKSKFLEINRAVPLPMFESLLRKEGANYLLTSNIFGNIPEYYTAITESGRFRFELLTTIGSLRVFAIHNRLTEPGFRSAPEIDSSASGTAADFFVQARRMLRSERYPEALKIFSKLEQQYPYQPEIQYQKLIIHALTADRASATADLQRIYTLAANTYISSSNVYLRAAQILYDAGTRSDAGTKAEDLYNAGKMLWDLGCNIQAYRFLQKAVQLDSLSFNCLLWAWHFGNQLQAPESKEYLKRLDALDAANPVVRTFHIISSLQDSITRSTDPNTRGKSFDDISSAYDGIELPMEAFDAAERAIGESPQNGQFRRYLDSLCEKHKYRLRNEKALY
jgi:tetratricopeptide (TPR) repeat protein